MHSVDKILRAGWEMLKNELGVFLNGTCQVGWRLEARRCWGCDEGQVKGGHPAKAGWPLQSQRQPQSAGETPV